MAISRLQLQDFTVFRRTRFDFSPGINIVVGENGTGKSHLLKVLYAIETAVWEQQPEGQQAPCIKFASLADRLRGAFRVPALNDLLRRTGPRGRADVRIEWDHKGWLSLILRSNEVSPTWKIHATAHRPLFLPTRQILSLCPGLAETIKNRELEFDQTYVHLAEALNLPPLKGEKLERAASLLAQIESALGGTEEREGRFFVTFNQQSFEAHLVAEGLCKIATLARLVRNGRLAAGMVLFWDQPEADLNPVLIRKVVRILVALATARVQIFLASHDYLLTQTLSLIAEHRNSATPPVRFFGLTRTADGSVSVEQADTIAGLAHNPILEGFAETPTAHR